MNSIKITESTVIKAKYAELPIIDLSRRFLVQVTEPIALIPVEIRTHINSGDLKDEILNYWNLYVLPEDGRNELPDNVIKPEGVELTECDLLVPKAV